MVGHLSVYGTDDVNGFAALSVAIAPQHHGTYASMEAVALFANYTFACTPLRKLYLHVPEPNMCSFRSAIGFLLEPEGILRRHMFMAGEYIDVRLLALYRDAALSLVPLLLGNGRDRAELVDAFKKSSRDHSDDRRS